MYLFNFDPELCNKFPIILTFVIQDKALLIQENIFHNSLTHARRNLLS